VERRRSALRGRFIQFLGRIKRLAIVRSEVEEKGYQILGLGNDFRAVRQVFGERMDWIEKG